MKIEKFFDEAARARVADAVKAAEARTSGQIVPVVVPRSRDYRSTTVEQGNTLGMLVLAAILFTQDPGLAALLNPLVIAAFGLLIVIQATLAARPRLLQSSEFEAAVRQRAMVAFVEHGVYRTREENGVLLFASLYERKVVVLGDRAVHEKLGDEHWNRAVATLVAGMRAGDPAEGFCKAIADIGEEMAKAFPRGSSSQPNEISDELRVDR